MNRLGSVARRIARVDPTLVAVAPGLLVAVVLVWFTGSEGGYFAATWYAGLVTMVMLALAVALGRSRALLSLPKISLAALGLGAAFVIWSFASIGWADSQGAALDGANRALLYFSIFAVFAVWPWNRRAAAIVIAALGVGVATVALWVLLDSIDAANPASYLVKGRFSEPIGYPNGNAAVLLLAALPLVHLAARPENAWYLRGIMLGSAGTLVQISLLSQSRGSLIAGVAALIAFFVLVPGRVRSALAIAALALATLSVLDPLLDVWSQATRSDAQVGEALGRASDSILASLVALIGVGTIWGLLDRSFDIGIEAGPRITRAVRIACVAIAVGGVASAVAVVGGPFDEIESAWDEFAEGHPSEFGESRFASGLGSYRSEYWDVALDELGRRPLTGMGAGNFVIAYARERPRASEEPLYPHSMPVEIASQTGIIGAILFGGFIAAALGTAWRARRLGPSGGIAGASIATFVYWLAHSSGDWLLAIPAATGIAFAALGLASGLGARQRSQSGGGQPAGKGARAGTAPAGEGRRGAYRLGLIALVTLAALALSVPAWLSAAYIDAGRHVWRTDAALAFERFDRARDLNPLSEAPDLAAGGIALELGNRERALAAFAGATERNPKSWFAQQQLGIEQALAGRSTAALEHLVRARELNPLEPTTRTLIRAARRGQRPPADQVRAELAAKACAPVPVASGC